MELGMIGLGRMGANMARRLQKGGIEVVAWNRDVKVTQDLAQETGLTAASNLADIVSRLKAPRIVWLMLPAGEVTQQHIDQLSALLSPDDIVVDGANSYYKDSMRRGQELTEKKLHYIDA
ncbi:MAG: NAD(P)-binding domain-containing protein, partial [Gammaproteobacteria bacterium]|nr:NAD(P)-binding domain-containing protein [Gammaproteobacteria bacterium]